VTVGVTTFEGVYEMNLGQVTAAGIIASIIPTVLAVASYKLIIEGLTAGAVKR
jgi:ABC-type glycerol-3-phosphate transport system permease component